MDKLILIFNIALFTLCCSHKVKTNSENTEHTNNKIDITTTKITFYKVNSQAILLGENIKLLDENIEEIKDISYLNGHFVEIKEVSEKYYKAKPTDDYCKEFKYVKIKTKDFEGYVDGRKLYEPIKHPQNKIVKIDNNEVSFIATSYFGIGISDNDGLTGCSINTPTVFSDKNAKYEGLLKMIKNKDYQSDYPYFELKDDDGANDEILNIDKQDKKYLLKIKRFYQEGEENLLVAIYKDKSGTFVAEILEKKRVEK